MVLEMREGRTRHAPGITKPRENGVEGHTVALDQSGQLGLRRLPERFEGKRGREGEGYRF